MEQEGKLIKQSSGALELKLMGKNHIICNWNDGIMEIFHNGKRKFIIDINNK